MTVDMTLDTALAPQDGDTSITLPPSPMPTPTAWDMIQKIAPAIYECRFYGVANVSQAMAIMLVGHELGFGLMGAFEYIHVIEGKPSISPRGALAKVMQSGQLEAWKLDELPDAFHCWMRRRNGMEYELTWGMADAVVAGLVKEKSGWSKYPKNMLKWRTIGYVLDVLFPDLMGGLKRADEYGATVDATGNVIEGEVAA